MIVPASGQSFTPCHGIAIKNALFPVVKEELSLCCSMGNYFNLWTQIPGGSKLWSAFAGAYENQAFNSIISLHGENKQRKAKNFSGSILIEFFLPARDET